MPTPGERLHGGSRRLVAVGRDAPFPEGKFDRPCPRGVAVSAGAEPHDPPNDATVGYNFKQRRISCRLQGGRSWRHHAAEWDCDVNVRTRKYARPVAEHSGFQSKHTASVGTGAANGLGLAPALAALNAGVTSRTRASSASRQATLRPWRPQNQSPLRNRADERPLSYRAADDVQRQAYLSQGPI